MLNDLNMLLTSPNCPIYANDFDKVLTTGNHDEIRAGFEKGQRPTQAVFNLVQGMCSLDIIKLISEFMPIDPEGVLSGAAVSGNLERLKLAREMYPQHMIMKSSTIGFAASSGHLDVLKYLHESYGDMEDIYDVNQAVGWSAREQNLHVLIWLTDHYRYIGDIRLPHWASFKKKSVFHCYTFLAANSMLYEATENDNAIMDVLDTLFIQCEHVPLGEPRMNLG